VGQFGGYSSERISTASGIRSSSRNSDKSAYIARMLSRVRNSRRRPINTPFAFIHPCRPIVVAQPPSGPGWAHELKHDGYKLQIHARDGRVRLYTITGADWSKRYPLIVEAAAKINGNVIVDAKVVWLDSDGIAQFDALPSRVNDGTAIALAFDLLMHNGKDVRRRPLAEGQGYPSQSTSVYPSRHSIRRTHRRQRRVQSHLQAWP
jgi:ATP-dependent DNA ligase